MKSSRRNFVKSASILTLSSIIPLSTIKLLSKKEPIIIGISTCGINLINSCAERKITAKYFALEQRNDDWINRANALRGYLNPDTNGEYYIKSFENMISDWFDSVFTNKTEIGTVIIVNCIGGIYGTMAGRGFFNQLQKLEIDVHWVFSQPYCSSENDRTKIANQYTSDILHLPNVITHSFENIRGCNKNLTEAEASRICNSNMIKEIKEIIS